MDRDDNVFGRISNDSTRGLPDRAKDGGKPKPPTEPLAAKMSRLTRAMADSARGPLLVALEVVAVGANWSAYKKEAGCDSFSSYLMTIFHQNERFFSQRADAVERLGSDCSRYLHHESAVWLAGQRGIDEPSLDRIKVASAELFNRTHQPISKRQVRTIRDKVIGTRKRPTPKKCSRCEELEAALLRVGVALPE